MCLKTVLTEIVDRSTILTTMMTGFDSYTMKKNESEPKSEEVRFPLTSDNPRLCNTRLFTIVFNKLPRFLK